MAREPGKWDYVAAGIPSALTEDMEATQLAKKVGDLCCHYTSR